VTWYQWKLLFQHSTGFSMDALHVIAGVLIQLAVAALFRTSVSGLVPWLTVLGIELVNEANDLRVEAWPSPGMQYGESIKDVVLTMFLPTLLLLVSKL
jgi:hypothetical protein